MYSEEMVSIGKIETGYLIQVRVPYKEMEHGEMEISSKEKQYHVADVAELVQKLALLLPALEDKEDADVAFKKSFKEAAANE